MKHFLPNSSNSEFKKLDLIGSLLETIAKACIEHNDSPWLDMRSHFARMLQVHYIEICQQVRFNNISEFTSILDGKYKQYLIEKANYCNVFDDISLIFSKRLNVKSENSKNSEMDVLLRKLFHLRKLCLNIYRKKEKILPLLPSKIVIGETLSTAEENCIPCERLCDGANNFSGHFLKLTPSQILILQDAGNMLEGTVVFSSYYKDLTWVKFHKTLVLRKIRIGEEMESGSIRLKFEQLSKILSISRTLRIAKDKQNEILQRKLEDLLETEYTQHKRGQ
ncbi:FPL domain-containing protein [Caerostris darwini]|uniref:FPL domain-containing protein n=1 Tax=Caerostris darwini TaxID=1538125 RepID=A0AAV4R7V6_9ARAC|nr:FPL domain-containing protein [Caerostris darwini]